MARATTKSTAAKPRRRTSSSTSTPKTAKKTPAVRRAADKPSSDAPKPVVISETTPVSDQLELRKPELIEMVVERSDVKKRYAKPVIEAALAILGEALADGREMNLKPLGKVKVNRLKQLSNARVLTCRVRQAPLIDNDANDPLAEAAE